MVELKNTSDGFEFSRKKILPPNSVPILRRVSTRSMLAFLIAGTGCVSDVDKREVDNQSQVVNLVPNKVDEVKKFSTEVIPGIRVESTDFTSEQIDSALKKAREIVPQGQEWWDFTYNGKPVKVILKKLNNMLDNADGLTDWSGVSGSDKNDPGFDVSKIPVSQKGTVVLYVDSSSMAHEFVHLLLGNTAYLSQDLNEFLAYMTDGGVKNDKNSDSKIKMHSIYISDEVGLVSLPSMKISDGFKAGIADIHAQRLRIVANEWAKDSRRVRTTVDCLRTFEKAKKTVTFDDYAHMIQSGILPNSKVFRRLNEDGHYMTIVRHPKNNLCVLHSAVIFGLHDEETTIGRYDKNVNLYVVDDTKPDAQPVLIGSHNFAKSYTVAIKVPQGDYFSLQVGENVNQRIPLPRAGRVNDARFDLEK